MHRRLLLLLLFVWVARAQEENNAIAQAIDALQHGDLAAAESTIRAELRVQPNNANALGLLGVVLDQEKKYAEADEIYRRALRLAPHSVALLNNYGNHLLATGKLSEAREAFLQVLALDPTHANAALQVARIALQRKTPAEALKYLQALPASVVAKDPRLNLAMGVALASAGKNHEAEGYLSRAVEATPGDFQALYFLGLAASHVGHDERAREVLQKALELQPQNSDVMYDLAAVDARTNRKEAALELLARAERIAPDRADVLFLLAHTAADLGYFADAVKTWEQYLKLRPQDEVARREHAFAETAVGENAQSGLADLQAYVRKHPAEAVGHYELAMAEIVNDKQAAAKELDRALVLKPDFVAAHVTRGLLKYRAGTPEAALPDLEFAAKHEPENPGVLDRLGEVYMALGRAQEALPVLKKAADLAPRDPTILLRYARALTKAGQKQEAAAVFDRYRELGPGKSALPHPAGLVDFLSLSPEEQRARYHAGVERTVQRDPANVEAQVRYLELLLEDGKTEQAHTVAQNIAGLNPDIALLEEAARVLLAAKQYSAEREFITRIGPTIPSELKLDLAIADSYVVSPNAGLDEVTQIPAARRDGDYYLALSTMLEMAGRAADATAAMKEALRRHATRADLYRELAALLINHHRTEEAAELLDQATVAFPDDSELSIMKNSLKTPTSN